MALINTSQNSVLWHGTIAGNTFYRDNAGAHIRAKQFSTKTGSTKQLAVRKAFAQAKNFWLRFGSLPDVARQWQLFADYPETAYQAFIRINWYRAFNGLSDLKFPPF